MGYTTVSLFTHACPDHSHVEHFLQRICLVATGEQYSPYAPQAAALRKAIKCCMDQPASQPSAPVPPPVFAASKPITVQEVRDLKDQFMKRYPGEFLNAASMPSVSFFTLLKEQIDAHCLTWIPWKSRTSEADELRFTETRRPRNDNQFLKTLLVSADDVRHIIEVAVSKCQALLSIALGMLGCAHLLVLKRFHSKFLDLAIARKPRDSHLRCPSWTEILERTRLRGCQSPS